MIVSGGLDTLTLSLESIEDIEGVYILRSQLDFPKGRAGKIVGVIDKQTTFLETDDNGENPEVYTNGILTVARALPSIDDGVPTESESSKSKLS